MTIALLVFLPAQHTSTAANGDPFRYVVTSGPMVNQPVEPEHVKDAEETFPGEACNCVTFVRNRVSGMPRMAETLPNADPAVGSVAIEFFGKVKHVSVVTAVHPHGVTVAEANYVHCETGTRFIPYNKYSLIGFWDK